MPIWTEIIKALPKVAREAYETLTPTAKQFAEFGITSTKGRVVPVLEASKSALSETKDITALEHVLQPLATQYHALSTGSNLKKAGIAVFAQTQDDLHEMTLPLREIAEKGKAAQPFDLTKLTQDTLPSSTSPVKYQADIKKIQERRAKAVSLGHKDKVAEYDDALDRMGKYVAGQPEVKDLPWVMQYGHLGASTKTKESLAFPAGVSMVMDKSAAIGWQDAFTKQSRAWWRSLTGKEGPGGGFKSMAKDKAFQKDMAELLADSWPQTEQYYSISTSVNNLSNKYKAALAAGNQEAAAKYLASMERLKPKFMAALTEVNKKRYPVLSKYFNQPDVRIALYRDPGTRAWVEPLMSEGEKQVAKSHQWLMQETAKLATANNIPVISGEYVTHLVKNLAKVGRVGGLDIARINRAIPAIMKFQRRNPGSLNFFPSIHASTEAYIPMVARKVAETSIASKWLPIIKDDLKYWPRIQKVYQKDIEQFLNKSMDEGFWEKAMRQMTWWTYFTKVGLSIPVAIKHMVKFGGLLAMHPRDAISALPTVLKGGMELAFQRFGVKPGPAARIMRNMTASRHLFEDMSGLTGAPELTSQMFRITNLISSSPVAWVEMLERGLGNMAAMNKATRLGLSYKQMKQGAWSTILENSFVGRADNFLWLNKPWQRFMAIFAYTPGMIIDRSLRWAMKGTTPERYITEMKGGLLQTAWQMPKDVFGTTYTKHLIAFATILGAAEIYAEHYGVKPWWVLQMGAAHPPSSLARPIPYEMMKEADKRGGTVEDWTSTLYDFMTTIPALDKAKAAWRGQLPKAAGGSQFFAVTGIPSAKAAKEREEQVKKWGGKEFGTKWHKKYAIKRRQETVLGPLYEGVVAPWRKP
ncbi:hypothetical protein N8192_00305 [bacterium]|nr:hypothetical protein [bacterium]